MDKLSCKGKRFGHNFIRAGGSCSRCGISQHELSQPTEVKGEVNKIKKRGRDKHLHSPIHVLADDLSRYFKEPKKFSMYLGIIKRIGLQRAYQIFSEVKQSDAKEPRKLFMWKTKQ